MGKECPPSLKSASRHGHNMFMFLHVLIVLSRRPVFYICSGLPDFIYLFWGQCVVVSLGVTCRGLS